MSKECTTHHHACDCREEKFKELERENSELRADKERLDWLGKVKCAYYHEGPCCWRINEDESTDGETIRAAIDAARKEQP